MRQSYRIAMIMATAAVIGMASGAASYFSFKGIYAENADKNGAIIVWMAFFGPGILFGVAIGLFLIKSNMSSFLRAAILVPLVAAAWFATFVFALNAEIRLGLPLTERWQLGIASGLLGASLLALAALLVFPFFRRLESVASIVVTGGAAGALLEVGGTDLLRFLQSLILFFTLWQGAVLACFGWAVARTSPYSGQK